MKIPELAERGFGSAAEVYERARPGYSSEAVAWVCKRLGIGPGRTVLDLGAGTGKLTRQLVGTGAHVVAVEPLDEMRAQLVEAVPEAEALGGTAEELPVADETVDAVLSAQAFHWFDPDRALPEIHRVLQPRGGLGLLWNTRDLSDEFQGRIDELLQPYQARSARYWTGTDDSVQASPLFTDVEHRTWPFEQHVTHDGLLEVVASRSYVASLDEESRSRLLKRVHELAAGLSEPIVLRYVVDVFVADRTL